MAVIRMPEFAWLTLILRVKALLYIVWLILNIIIIKVICAR